MSPPADDARTRAVQAVMGALRGAQFAQDAFAAERPAGGDPREMGLSFAIALGTLRHLITIEHVLGRVAKYEPRRVRADVRAAICTGAFQLVWMDRVPDYAAVDAAVEIARRTSGVPAARMVNAVLRRVGRAIEATGVAWQRGAAREVRTGWETACRFREAVLPEPADEAGWSRYLAAAAGERPGRFAQLVERHGRAAAEAVAWASQAIPAVMLVRNPRRCAAEEFVNAARASGAELSARDGDHAFLPAGVAAGALELVQTGQAYVQDPTAAAAAQAVAAQPGERVLDLCAAPGGKALALALALEDRGEVLACDLDRERLGRVAENATRLELRSIRPLAVDATDPGEALAAGAFDAVLVDAPCSNTGVIARRPEARLGLTEQKLAALVVLQEQLLATARRCVRPGGRIVYSTCSIEPAENDGVVGAFAQGDAGVALQDSALTLPAWGPRPQDWRDGGYWARLACD
jgi:16S rRNA (cytosine967-C5)-methyltransferase